MTDEFAPVKVADRQPFLTPTFVLLFVSLILNAAGLIGIGLPPHFAGSTGFHSRLSPTGLWPCAL